VVVPLTTSAWLLPRNLHCTAVTRAKQIVVLVGSRRALAKAVVRTRGAGRRYTALAERLHSMCLRVTG
jgi:exodeoxyribonuclease V alpha subunit